VLINEVGEYVEVNDAALDLHGYERKQFEEMMVTELADTDPLKHGKFLEKALNGEKEPEVFITNHADGHQLKVRVETETTEIDGDTYIISEHEMVEVLDETPQSSKGNGDGSNPDYDLNLDHIPDWEIAEISNNIRIDSPSGEMTLGSIMLDLAVMHNEIEQTKQGAYNLYLALDDRLAEEEKRNGSEVTCDIIQEAKETAFGLFLRIERGDKELHGDRPGKYSGYFD